MTVAAIITAIRDRLTTAMPSTLRLVIDNAPDQAEVSSYATAAIQIDNTVQVSMPPRYRVTGALIVNVTMPAGSGDAAVNAHCDTIAAAFRGGDIASPMVAFRPAPTVTGAIQRADGWAARTVRIPFRADFT
jgi:hypothetical protein